MHHHIQRIVPRERRPTDQSRGSTFYTQKMTTERSLLRFTIAFNCRGIRGSRSDLFAGSGGFQNLAGRVGSVRGVLGMSRTGPGYPDPARPATIDTLARSDPARSDLTREKP